MSLLGAMLKPTTLKMRLLMMALFAVGIVLSGGGIAYAQSAEEVMGTLDNAILVFAAALVFFMQAGFAFLGAGLIRAKNTVNYMTKSFLDFCIASLGFWAFGYALMFGGGALADCGRRDCRISRICRADWILPSQFRRWRSCEMVLPDGVRGHGGDDNSGSDGRAHED